ncbi:MAG TPA: alpha/beta fold hydrolase, partial [Thermoleophilaceae bacterium]|nr:alpha/beta fold hydrolase [Thermoleophilaceae bacterium]
YNPARMAADLAGDFGGTFPFEARFLEVDDLRIHYVDEGDRDAAPILMLHGNPTWSYMYRGPIRSLSERGHRCIAFDHMGFGRSSKPPEPRRYILSTHVQNAIAVLDQLDLNDVTLVCHDWGGPIGLAAALERPRRVSRVVAMNTWAWELPSFLPSFLRQFRSEGLGEILALASNAVVESIPGGMISRDSDGAMMEAYRAPHPDYWSRLGTLAFIRDIPLTEHDVSAPLMGHIHESLPELNVPLLLVWGMRDRVFVPAFLDQWQAVFPDAHKIELQAGHYLVEDAPDQVADAIHEFVPA